MPGETITSPLSGGWKVINTLLGAAGTSMGATALGSKTSEQRVREIIAEENAGRGGHRGGCCAEPLVNRYELAQSQRISELESARETDAKLLEVYKAAAASDQRQDEKFAALTKSLTDYVIANNREVDAIKCDARVNQQAINDNFRYLDYKIDNNHKEVLAYVDCHTIPLEKKVGINSICPMPLAASSPVAIQGQILTTTPTGDTNTVVGTVRAVTK
jgi:hypothetical protein